MPIFFMERKMLFTRVLEAVSLTLVAAGFAIAVLNFGIPTIA